MTRLFFLLITTIMWALGLFAVASNWQKDRAKMDEGMVVAAIAMLGFLTTYTL